MSTRVRLTCIPAGQSRSMTSNLNWTLRDTNTSRMQADRAFNSVSGNTLEIFRRSFRFHDGAEDALRFSVQLQSSKVRSLRDLESGRTLDLVRLEPAEIAAIYPLQKEDRTLVRIKQVPPLLLTGLQAVEDRNFKHHPGVDLKGIARAALANLRARMGCSGRQYAHATTGQELFPFE